jgi:hypothetical protein
MRKANVGLAVGLCVAAGLWVGVGQAGPQWALTEDSWIKLSLMAQAHYVYEQDAADREDFFLRRGRIILNGQVMDGILFFVETDNDTAGKNGAGNVSTDIQDAFVDFRLFKTPSCEAWVAGGLILLPFSFESKASAASLLGNDYNLETIRLVNTFVWRDYGAELHGNFGKKVSYRVGAFDGYDPYATTAIRKNNDAALRYTGHAAVNVLGDAETGFFYTQERLQKGHYLSLGAGFDTQENATRTIPATADDPSVEQNSDAWVVDVQSGFEAGPVSVTLNGAYYDYDNGLFRGNTAFVESGVKAFNAAITGKWLAVDPKAGDETTDWTVGAHYFFKKHNARAGVEYRWGDSNDAILGAVQVLL